MSGEVDRTAELEGGKKLPTYFRLHSYLVRLLDSNPSELPGEVKDLVFHPNVTRLPWLTSMFAITNCESLTKWEFTSQLFHWGLIYGIDPASAYVVHVLDPLPGQNVLDLCCAPGGKLCYIAEKINFDGQLIGIDNNQKRINTCASVLRKYSICRQVAHKDYCLLLMLGDATKIRLRVEGNEKSNQRVAWSSLHEIEAMKSPKTYLATIDFKSNSKKRKLADNVQSTPPDISLTTELLKVIKELGVGPKSVCKSLKARLNTMGTMQLIENDLFDRVLVDAECSTDGSYSHIYKNANGLSFWLESDTRQIELRNLQRDLLMNGFNHLKLGGTLIYSTCSFLESQNEDIVRYLLTTQPSAQIVEIPAVNVPCIHSKVLPGTIMFTPDVSKTSGLFVAKITKK